MGKKRSQGSGTAVWWFLIFAVAAFLAWILWRSANPKTPVQGQGAPTNRLDFAHASNLLHWLNTNLIERAATATNVVIITPTNRALPKTNLFAPAPSISLAVKSNLPALPFNPTPRPETPAVERPIRNPLEAQIAMARLGVSCGPIDGALGSQTRAAVRAFQKENGLPGTGDLDGSTRAVLTIEEPVFTTYTVTMADL